MKKKIQRNLKVLEQQNLVSSKNDYQEIVNAIAKVGLVTFTDNIESTVWSVFGTGCFD